MSNQWSLQSDELEHKRTGGGVPRHMAKHGTHAPAARRMASQRRTGGLLQKHMPQHEVDMKMTAMIAASRKPSLMAHSGISSAQSEEKSSSAQPAVCRLCSIDVPECTGLGDSAIQVLSVHVDRDMNAHQTTAVVAGCTVWHCTPLARSLFTHCTPTANQIAQKIMDRIVQVPQHTHSFLLRAVLVPQYIVLAGFLRLCLCTAVGHLRNTVAIGKQEYIFNLEYIFNSVLHTGQARCPSTQPSIFGQLNETVVKLEDNDAVHTQADSAGAKASSTPGPAQTNRSGAQL